jgi:hypothetical protein
VATVIALLLQVALLGVKPVPDPLPMSGESRTYHGVSIAAVKDTKWTHIAVCGQVTLVQREDDGDAHLRIVDPDPGSRIQTFIVAEIVPYHLLPLPKVGQFVRVAGIHRYDKVHQWEEIHPAEAIAVVASCKT